MWLLWQLSRLYSGIFTGSVYDLNSLFILVTGFAFFLVLRKTVCIVSLKVTLIPEELL